MRELSIESTGMLINDVIEGIKIPAAAGQIQEIVPPIRGVWLEMWSQSDPFRVQDEAIRMDLRWVSQLAGGSAVDLHRGGIFQVQKRDKQGSVETLSGTFKGLQTVEIGGAGSASSSSSTRLTLSVGISRRLLLGGGGWWTLRVQRGQRVFCLNWRVARDGLAAVAGHRESVPPLLAGAVLKQNSPLAAPGNPTRTSVEAILKVLSQQLGDEQFSTYAKQRLFPREESGPRDLVLHYA